VRDFYTNGGKKSRLYTAIGAAFDFKVAKGMAKKAGVEIEVKCDCGAVDPDRNHWMHKCPKLRDGPPSMPTRLAMSKLAIPRVPRGRKANARVLPIPTIRKIAAGIRRAAKKGGKVVLATDGGSTGKTVWQRCGGWGIAVDGLKESGELEGLDHSAYAAELWAALVAVHAIKLANVEATIIIDNLAVQKKVREAIFSAKWRTPQFFSSLWRELKQLVASCTKPLHCYWVPAHGKHQEWTAPDGFLTKHWRGLNDDADEGAARTAQELWARWEIQRTAKVIAEEAAQKALQRCEAGSARLLEVTLELPWTDHNY